MNTAYRASRAAGAEVTREHVLPIPFSYTA
jgi:hypothetical protein